MFEDRRTRKDGISAEARVISVRKRSNITTNELRDYDHELEVRPNDRPPFEANVRAKFWIAGLRPKEEDIVRVKFDPKSLHVVFDLDGDPRYDLKAAQAQNTAARRQQAAFGRGEIPFAGLVGSAPVAAAPTAAPRPDPLDLLERLEKLREAGALTQDEFAAQKARILGDG